MRQRERRRQRQCNLTHVVAAHTADLRVGRQAAFHELLADLLHRLAHGHAAPHKVRHLLVAQAVPDAVARQHEELLLAVDVVRDDLGVGRDDLRLGREAVVLLELKVANGARERQVAVHAAELDEATSRHDARVLPCAASGCEHMCARKRGVQARRTLVPGLVVIAHRLGLAAHAQDTPRVASVGDNDAPRDLLLRAVSGVARRAGDQQCGNSRAARRVVGKLCVCAARAT